MVSTAAPKMVYRYLGNSGLKVSLFSFGNWLNSMKQEDYEITRDAIKICLENGVNFFDTAEIYGMGAAETQMGKAFKELSIKREDIVVSTKIFRCGAGVNDTFLSRKHIVEGLRASLKRLETEYVDVVFCHRPDFETPLEETVRAMSYVIDQGMAFYWGTSEWPADRISKAIELCERLNLHKPIVEQPQYSMFWRSSFEKDYRRIFSEYKYGSTIWSPLAGGILTGKYNDGVAPEGSRFQNHIGYLAPHWDRWFGEKSKEANLKRLNGLAEYAKELGYSQAQLALAWAVANQDVSTCILGFTKIEQVTENLKALELYLKWDESIENRCKEILFNDPEADMDWRKWAPLPSRRSEATQNPKQ
ncbi:aldo keto reductase family protein [Stylonychia lemnae]|uniref:Aldo keto reductase family protein n=1 Tax=Stylonychia lemnae TaxID=5949 RepID=A0A078ATY4_STYLE|nr:aldo keto reductase family protein [Stylonychia lemnae]|eukprot:CDW85421.1 aldo keto reductase family protein [Stylonychia lemnae]